MWKQLWVSLSACSFTASTTRESVCPTFITPMPPPKSMNVLPSTSVRRAPFASLANIGVAIPTPEETALCRRSIKARLFGPGISVLILVDSSIVATSSCRANSFQYTRRRYSSDTPERDSRACCLHRARFLGEREQAEKLVRYVGGEEGRGRRQGRSLPTISRPARPCTDSCASRLVILRPPALRRWRRSASLSCSADA